MSLLDSLTQIKGRFGPDAAQEAVRLLEVAKKSEWSDPEQLIHFHETVLYLRAYPQSPDVLRLADEILFAFSERVQDKEKEPFEYPEISGIAGTGLTTNYSHPFAQSLAVRHGSKVNIDWNQFKHAHRLASIIAKKNPAAREDWAIAPHPDWRAWYEKSGGQLDWLIEGTSAEVFDLLELLIRWEIGDSHASRSRSRLPRKKIFYHQEPFLTRKQVSLEEEFAAPPIPVRKLSAKEVAKILPVIIDASAVRYRELYGFLYPDTNNVFHTDLGRGIDLYFFGVPRKWKLPSREYCAGMYFKNGVPIGYVEVMWREKKMEVGFNLYYTFRQGETAWLYAKLLKIFRQRFRVDTFFIDPYQIGHDNDEAIESGAFWFYHKLGFRSESKEIEALAAKEEKKIAADPTYRTPPRVLKKLATHPVAYKVGKRGA
ncbi:MAG: hypothetical protein ABL967_02990 [Bryobacteraceae bacterium]